LAYGFVLRWQALQDVKNRPLWPDVIGVLQIAQGMKHPYDTWVREPLWPCLAKLYLVVLGGSPLALRYLSLTFGMLLIALAFVFARDYTGRSALAVLVAALVARHPYLIGSSVEGHRTELLAVALLGFLYFVFVRNVGKAARTAGLTTGVAACGLTTFSLTMVSAPPLLAWCQWRHRQGWWATVAVPLGTALMLVVPHLVHVWATKGDPFYFENVFGGVFYRNYEFVVIKKGGCDGCPSRAELAKNFFAGRPTTLRHYIFGLHSPSEVAERVVTGYRELYLSGDLHRVWLGFSPGRIRWLYWVGLVAITLGPYRELLLWPVLTINLLAFIIPLGIDPRLVMHTAVFGSLAAALPAWWGARAITAALIFLTCSMGWPERSLRSLACPWLG
jgi:hypothetical protein